MAPDRDNSTSRQYGTSQIRPQYMVQHMSIWVKTPPACPRRSRQLAPAGGWTRRAASGTPYACCPSHVGFLNSTLLARRAEAGDGRRPAAGPGRPRLAFAALAAGGVCGDGRRARRGAALPRALRQHGRRRVQELAGRAGGHLAGARGGAARRVQGPGAALPKTLIPTA